jgi:hypothetical protein
MPTPDASEYDARMAHARDGLLSKAITKAHERADELGVTLTDEQAAEAGARILKREQAERATQARNRRVEQAREDFANWGAGQCIDAARRLNAFNPTLDYRTAARLLLNHLRDELDAPDGYSRRRLIARLNADVEDAKWLGTNRSIELSAMLPDIDTEGLTLDDVAAEEGLAPWADR